MGVMAVEKHQHDRTNILPLSQLEDLAQATQVPYLIILFYFRVQIEIEIEIEIQMLSALQDMHDMKNCYDSLLSAAAATANSAYGMLCTAASPIPILIIFPFS